jgi:hypothetical protein
MNDSKAVVKNPKPPSGPWKIGRRLSPSDNGSNTTPWKIDLEALETDETGAWQCG